MYNTKMDEATKDAIRMGNNKLLLKALEEGDKNLIEDLKVQQDARNVAFLQGASYITDRLISLLKVPV